MNKITVFESDKLLIESVEIGMLGNNVYYIQSESELAIVDPSCRADDLIAFCGDKPVSKVLLTHYHFDHIGAAQEVKDCFNAVSFASVADSDFIDGTTPPPVMHRRVNTCKIDKRLVDGDEVIVGKTTWQVIDTPGHTKGGICFYCENSGVDKNGISMPPLLICGDTLFQCSCGRTDFVDSDPVAMRASLSKLSKLPDNTLVLPGHGPATTIVNERNFMLSGLN